MKVHRYVEVEEEVWYYLIRRLNLVLSEELAIFSWRNRPLDEKPNSLNFGHFLINLVLPRHHYFHTFNFIS